MPVVRDEEVVGSNPATPTPIRPFDQSEYGQRAFAVSTAETARRRSVDVCEMILRCRVVVEASAAASCLVGSLCRWVTRRVTGHGDTAPVAGGVCRWPTGCC